MLNALRHQRNDRGRSRQFPLPYRFVLNALRHQRNDRVANYELLEQKIKCSTPYGIKGTIAVGFGMFFTLLCYACSTPYGIKGTIAAVLWISPVVLISAQRLTASKERSQQTRPELLK